MTAMLGLFLAGAGALRAEGEWQVSDFFAPADVGNAKIMLPANFSASKYGKGKYRLDGPQSRGQLNCLFFHFENAAEATANASLLEWKASTALINDSKALVREAIFLNPFQAAPPPEAVVLKIRLTAQNEDIAGELQQTAEKILKKNAADP